MDTWGRLPDETKDAISLTAERVSDEALNERFSEADGRVIFRISRKTDRALAGTLDVDLAADEEAPPEEQPPGEVADEYEVVEITLIAPDDFDYEPEITEQDAQAASPIDEALAELEGYYREDQIGDEIALAGETAGEAAGLPPVVDRRSSQSPVKNQAGRGTCVAHASMGVLEAYGHVPDDLSEQYTHYKFNDFLGRRHDSNSGLRTTDAAPFLARGDGRVCLEADWPYIPDQATINAMVAAGTYGPPAAAVSSQDYGFGAYKIITDQGSTGQSIKNVRYLEALVFQGYNVVIGTWVSWDDKNNDGVLDPVLDENGKPVGKGGHAMLIVGYNRPGQYFIVKNSWSAGWGHSGYAYLHYNLARSCFKYGFVVKSVVPPEPTRLPRQLGRAPYSTDAISRPELRAAVLFLRTSRGRYAVCEAYAGDNLHLRNLRVYNPDGTVHLRRDSLVIRGTYLCDIDSARETSADADFWWRAVRPGVNYLVPRNGAQAHLALNVAALRAHHIDAANPGTDPVASADLDYAFIAGRTTAGRRYKMLAHLGPSTSLRISYLEVYKSDGSRYRYGRDITVPSSWTFNLDTLQQGGGSGADIWWHVISANVGYLERYSSARLKLLWKL